MKLFLLSAQLLLVILKLQGVIHWSWLTILIPSEIIAGLFVIQIAAALVAVACLKLRRRAMTPGERAAESLAHYYATHRSKF
jgi:hypothetical protein